MAIEFEFETFFNVLDRTKEQVLESAIVGVHDATDVLLATSRDEAPLQGGTLRTTAGKDVIIDGNTVTGEVYYSATEEGRSGRVNYAVIVHEMGEYKNPSTPGTRPKFLERPLKRDAKKYNGMIASAIRKGLR